MSAGGMLVLQTRPELLHRSPKRKEGSGFPKGMGPMDEQIIDDGERRRLRRREGELLERSERLKRSMNETKALDTLAFKSKLFKETQEELRRIQEKLAAGPDPESD